MNVAAAIAVPHDNSHKTTLLSNYNVFFNMQHRC